MHRLPGVGGVRGLVGDAVAEGAEGPRAAVRDRDGDRALVHRDHAPARRELDGEDATPAEGEDARKNNGKNNGKQNGKRK